MFSSPSGYQKPGQTGLMFSPAGLQSGGSPHPNFLTSAPIALSPSFTTPLPHTNSSGLLSTSIPDLGQPMTLGSPVGSPRAASSSSQPHFLPEYLLGQSQSFIHSGRERRSRRSSSPSRPTQHHRSGSLHAVDRNRQHSYMLPADSDKRKVGGPPVIGLLDNISPTRDLSHTSPDSYLGSSEKDQPSRSVIGMAKGVPSPSSPPRHANILNQDSFSVTHSPSKLDSTSFRENLDRSIRHTKRTINPAEVDPFFTQGSSLCTDDELDDTWVTVFGFPHSLASVVLQEFAHYGVILEHRVSANSNWLHIHYQNKFQAKKAISRNGKVIGGEVMVGVMPCIDKNVESGSNRHIDRSSNTVPAISMSSTSCGQGNGSLNTSKASMRLLTGSYRKPSSDHEMSAIDGGSTGFLKKAMEYVFGW